MKKFKIYLIAIIISLLFIVTSCDLIDKYIGSSDNNINNDTITNVVTCDTIIGIDTLEYKRD